jgi:hypothetical protein
MSAPVTEHTRTAARGAVRARADTIPAQRGVAVPVDRPGSSPGRDEPARRAVRKARARRDDRLHRLTGIGPAKAAAPAGRPQFVLLIMVLLVVGLAATLWFSTAAAADSYRLQDARAAARQLSEQVERLHREVAVMQSAPELARRAAAMGMVPVQDPARVVVASDGSVTVVGQPRAAVAPAPPAPPRPPAPAAAPQPDAGQAASTGPDAGGADATPPGGEEAGGAVDAAAPGATEAGPDETGAAQSDAAQANTDGAGTGEPGAVGTAGGEGTG